MLKYYFRYYKKKLGLLKDAREKSGSYYTKVGLIDPSIGTTNLGDYIIKEAVHRHLREIFKDAMITSYPSHFQTDYDAKREIFMNDLAFVGGTNLLSSEMDKYNQWKIGPIDKLFLKNTPILMGVGWWQYQKAPNSYTQSLLTSVLTKDFVHSVRDGYTAKMLTDIGITNVFNTTCPTLWQIDDKVCQAVPTTKTKKVVTTLTFYKAHHKEDKELLEILIGAFEVVYLWIQGVEDYPYLQELGVDLSRITLIPPTLEAFNDVLADSDTEYIGTRLHAGIRALQLTRRTMILAVDNRAIEIGKDVNLNVIPIKEVASVRDYLKNEYVTKIQLPAENIRNWKAQFSKWGEKVKATTV